MKHSEWAAKGRKLFGDDVTKWKFVCPICGHVASYQEYKDVGAKDEQIAFVCIGRFLDEPVTKAFGSDTKGNGPCDYSGGGLFKMNPVEVDGHSYFDFAESANGV